MKRSLKKLSALLLLMGLFVLTGCAAKETLPNEEVYQGKLDSYVEMLAGTDKESLDANLSNLQENYDDFEQLMDQLVPLLMVGPLLKKA